ncbi:hypothetical protein LOK49_LG07G02593 [Camellia lanceoleosa]|uniref:Uncharacterized protein n=1 Tax=Camellia lanceoleosa TaxID=1840588 RepID=A0ACC0H609_9ERIC|nr:hypothetical protein LOK49_LG07G02593 [Camellia lanceoleosa]
MKKTLFFNLIPSKAEEDAAKATNTQFQVSRVLVEIRDLYPPPLPDPNNPWQIRKRTTPNDVATGRLVLSYNDTFEHIFRHWTVDMANFVLYGNKAPVVVWDVTEDTNPLRYRSDSIYFEKASNADDFFVLGWLDLARTRLVNPGDEVGLYWDPRYVGLDPNESFLRVESKTHADGTHVTYA